MKKVLIPTKLSPVAAEILAQKGYEVIQNANASIEELAAEHPDATGMIVRSEKVTPTVIDALPELKVVVRAGAGYNTIDTKYAMRKNVAVMNTPGANANAVAEEVVGMMLAGSRHFVAADKSVRAGLWEKAKFMGTEITGKTVGIVGFGNIGQLLARRLKGFDNKVLIYDPFISRDKANELGVTLSSLEEIFSNCDYISLHIPATEETTGLINQKFFDLMKNGSMLINCARSEVINEEDLRTARKTKKIFYCNDVYAKDIAGEKSVCDVADITLPHLGASTIEANTTAASRAASQLIDFLEKGVSTFVVNRKTPQGLSEDYQKLSYTIANLARQIIGNAVWPHEIQVSFYGKLAQFGKHLIPSVVAGVSKSFDPVNDYKDAELYLESKGIALKERVADESKNYGESITIDLLEGDKDLRRVSIRGTLTEGNIIISRIDNFDKLYFEPKGEMLVFMYNDRPGVLAQITQAVAAEGINIEDIRSPHNLHGNNSIAILKVSHALSQGTVDKIGRELDCQVACYINI